MLFLLYHLSPHLLPAIRHTVLFRLSSIQEPDGTIHKVTRRTDLTGERS